MTHRTSVASPQSARLPESLLEADAYPHLVSQVELVETHISWVLLTDEFAYKIKKPVVLDFLDFGDVDKRRYYCEEEIRLNKRWAPDIYLDVVPVTEAASGAAFTGSGEVIDYAVRMRRFDQSLRLDRQLEAGLLSVADMKELGAAIAMRHKKADRVGEAGRERVLRLTRQFMLDNFEALDGAIPDTLIAPLRDWTLGQLDRHGALLAQRFDAGFVRDCHGDLHLGNLVRLPDGITTFDCIEFSDDLRHIDVVADIAFLVMDLVERGGHDLAAHFLNRYLEATGDYGGVALLDLFFVYRCLVRAKVAVIRSRERDEAMDAKRDLDEASDYCGLAARQSAGRKPGLIIMHGLSGSGKTRVSSELMAALPAIRIRSDIERKRLHGIAEDARSESGISEGLYTAAASERLYDDLRNLARIVLDSGHSVILDAAFLHAAPRRSAVQLANEVDCPVVIVDVTAPESVLRSRLSARALARDDASEADVDVLDYQLRTQDSFSESEEALVIGWENVGDIDATTLVAELRNRFETQDDRIPTGYIQP
jgi:aminoglycoside phosphotransferase family enzyme/predicted kinase